MRSYDLFSVIKVRIRLWITVSESGSNCQTLRFLGKRSGCLTYSHFLIIICDRHLDNFDLSLQIYNGGKAYTKLYIHTQ